MAWDARDKRNGKGKQKKNNSISSTYTSQRLATMKKVGGGGGYKRCEIGTKDCPVRQMA